MCEVNKKLTDNQMEMSLAFEILPGEIWEKIFKYLKTSPSDLATCMNTCGQWYNLLKSERTTVLFPMVFKILAESKEVDWTRKSRGRNDDDDATEPLTRTRLLSCRLVSKTWNDAILSFIQWHPAHFQLDDLTSSTYSQDSWLRDLNKWSNQRMVEQFLEHFGVTHIDKNPFVSRHLKITDFRLFELEQEAEDPQIFYRLVTRVLEMFGDHVWHFHVDVSSGLRFFSYYALLQTWLTLMPNLKTLRIYYNVKLNDTDEDDASDYCPFGISLGNMMAFQNHMETTPLPVLKNLALLGLSRVPPPLALSLLGKCGDSLECLAIEGGIVVTQFGKVPLPFSKLPEMTCLKKASIILNDEIELMALEGAFASEDYANLWPLESLYIGYNQPHLFDEDCEVFDFGPSWERLFRFVNLFKDTLTELKLDLPKVYYNWEKRRIYRQSSRLIFNLRLPKLKRLRVQFWNRTSIDFLLPLKNLEELEIRKHGNEPVPPMAKFRSARKIQIPHRMPEIIQFHGWYMRRMWDSNIWRKLPRLRLLTVETKSPKKLFGCRIRHEYRLVKRDETQVEVVPRITLLF